VVNSVASPEISRDFFDATRVGWHVLFAAMDVLAAAFLLVDGHAVWMLVPAGLAIVYLALVVPPCSERARMPRTIAYLVVAYAAIGVLTWVDPNTLVLLFTLYPETFITLPSPAAIAATVLLTAIFTVVLVAENGWTAQAFSTHGFGGVVTLGFALVLGLFLTGVVNQSSQRRTLIEELTAARAQLDDAQLRAAATAERERLARDIHDTLAQGYTSIVMLAQATDAALAAGKLDEARHRVEQIDDTARENLAEARSLVAALQPPALEGRSLQAALHRLVERFQRETGIESAFTVDGEPREHSANVDVVLIRAAQEALTNVRRHAEAQHVAVRLTGRERDTELEVRDDGHGFDPSAAATGYGLPGLRARAAEVGGNVTIDSGASGTVVRVTVP
jgi:signal transduction histidine kinase